MKRSLVFLCLVTLAVALLVGAAQAPPAAALTFAPHIEHSTGTAPFFATVGEFNGDGRADLAATSLVNPNGTVIVKLGDGGGDFSMATGSPITLGNQPAAIAVGHFNADTYQDMAVPNFGSGNVSVLLGDGLGGFTPAAASPFATGANPRHVAVGYFNGDAFADLALPISGGAGVTVLLGDGLGGFAPAAASPFATGTQPVSVAIADFDGSGSADIAVANQGANSVSVLLGDGLGGFTPAAVSPVTVGAGPVVLVAADFDADGKADLATSNASGNTVSVLLNTTDAGVVSFAPQTQFFAGYQPFYLATGDVNGDGWTDLVTITSVLYLSAVHVLLNDGAGGMWPAVDFATGLAPSSVAVGDFNGGQLDLVTADQLAGLNAMSVLLNTTKSKIIAIKPAKARPGATVTITGTAFGAVRGKARVYFGTRAASKYTFWSQTKIKVKVPKLAAGKKSVTARTVEGKSNAKALRIL